MRVLEPELDIPDSVASESRAQLVVVGRGAELALRVEGDEPHEWGDVLEPRDGLRPALDVAEAAVAAQAPAERAEQDLRSLLCGDGGERAADPGAQELPGERSQGGTNGA
ncbi:MAG: hypothetical protein H0V45_05425 [Actinobacteria bacterium]|nr:hypothetical protein [Actinomycetota bacterium]